MRHMAALLRWIAIGPVAVIVVRETVAYNGHLGRYEEERWEVKFLGAERTLQPERMP